MTRDRIKYSAMQATGFHESADDALAKLAVDCTLDAWPQSLSSVCGIAGNFWSTPDEKWLRKQREREEKAAYKAAKEQMVDAVRADPQAYGVGFISLIFLGIKVAEILWPIIRALFDMRYNGRDGDVQAACGRVP